ncbi:hypothetical protein GCM10022205_43490 [Spinactinospora alkalitolerans]
MDGLGGPDPATSHPGTADGAGRGFGPGRLNSGPKEVRYRGGFPIALKHGDRDRKDDSP